MDSEDQIKRLGFDAWADNQFVNAIEDFVMPGSGKVSLTTDKMCMNIYWDEIEISCVIRAYTETGWQTYDKTIKNDGR